ncbi:MAG: phosphate ABC transporter [Spirochaetaceae bacterium]|nr:MAG: phosphate ABC transporter [Spirochaetaceae bacterium]
MNLTYLELRCPISGALLRFVTHLMLTLALVCGTAHLAGAQTNRAGEFVAVGATTIQPIIAHALETFMPGTQLEPRLEGGGSSAAVPAVRSGRADIGMISRSLLPNESEELASVTIGYDALAIIVNSMNPLDSLSVEEVRNIYTGRRRSWSGMPSWATEIVVVSKQIGRGTLDVFEEYSGLVSPFHSDISGEGRELIFAEAWEAGGNLDSILWVGGVPAAIGYVSLGEADRFIELGHPIKKVMLDGVAAELPRVADRGYPIRRELNLVYRRDNIQAVAFAQYMLGKEGQDSVRELGFAPRSFGELSE